ncbi:MAG: maleylpyruvate isomerase family mycothiol-dependent enzyme [Actinomycetota bacterium]
MDTATRVAGLSSEGSHLIALCTADLDADVPTCPGWQARNLLSHVASAWSAFAMFTEDASVEPPTFDRIQGPPEDDAGMVAFAEAALERIVASVRDADPAAPVWTWWGERTLAFYQRRSHIETVVHRLDAESITGVNTPIDADVGVDGVDEFYGEIVAHPGEPPSGTFHIHQTDGDGEFMLSVVDGAIVVTHEHGKGDAALRATGDELLRVVWGRRDLDGLEVFGDTAVADVWTGLAP